MIVQNVSALNKTIHHDAGSYMELTYQYTVKPVYNDHL